ncbi:hypothetical protein EJ357_47570 [Streptomyces cyaneochromogenes]|uniref:Uncharacterized protein n=1 Tax=Streptomyces cyaneochromogenes TaxID=2496836 RepID=A0A3Q9ENL8_9ACTN|nr:hypothetical protein [Streptomyces cyaneochromogenes]AZQ32128.1 hypothetical protein EJ357_00360 [Streptomyces cyaneochromogenes]AZQ40095.1 hypothetical protein EJ357_47570 [Streptomyces cyaneochromogenes]
MGSKVSVLAFAHQTPREVLHSELVDDAVSSRRLVERILPDQGMEPVGPVTLDEALWPLPGIACAGSFEGLELITSQDLRERRPSDLTDDIHRWGDDRSAFAVFMDSIVGWAAFAMWDHGRLRRSVSISHEEGIIEDEGVRFTFEQTYWDRSLSSRLGFHPIELGNEALRAFFGFVLEGRWDQHCIDPEEIAVTEYRAQNAGYRQQLIRERAARMIRRA